MTLTGRSIIAGLPSPATGSTIHAQNPATASPLEPPFMLIDESEVDRAAEAASEAFDVYRATSPSTRAAFLEHIADELELRRDGLLERAGQETGLPEGRLRGEHARATGQLRAFARELRLGVHQEVRIDHALPHRTPAARPDLRQRQVPLGPVAVFGASNFPFAFSTAGGDTAAALAAGCPVIVKAHHSHPGTAEISGQAITAAVAACGLPAGTFSLVFGAGSVVGQALAAHPAIKAIAFTGSRTGGTALMRTAAERPEPIPVYAEMSSINPVILYAGALQADLPGLAVGFVASLTLGSGQFCTNPGLVFVPAVQADAFAAAVTEQLSAAAGQTMLSTGIRRAYDDGLDRLGRAGAALVATGRAGAGCNAPAPALFRTTATRLRTTPKLNDEVFGAAALLVSVDDDTSLAAALESLGGQLTMTVHAADSDAATVAALLPLLERKAGRLLYNGWPTGVEVTDAMTHGGPFPATSDSRTTSVGTLAIQRFQRPVTYQGFPEALLPEAVQEANPWRLPRRVDGTPTLPDAR